MACSSSRGSSRPARAVSRSSRGYARLWCVPSLPLRVALYPGSFDPLTMGHVDIIQRGSALFDTIIVAVLENVSKEPLFTVKERIEMIQDTFKTSDNVEAAAFSGLLVEYAAARKASTIVRGIRAISDFEYEFQMALMNRRLAPTIETVFMMPAEEYSYVSSRIVKEVASLGGKVTGLVPEGVEARLLERVRER
ncbi:MAG: pantetheine-phosphate adenylyltransferase [Acidobacteria bacterium]|nr:MAG: pantetheine-phosphate adenylyltransferase [Acidobacteriota bacterium]